MKPLLFHDIESTGTDIMNDRIVQICAIKNGKKLEKLINPGMPIPEEATKIHGITDDMVKDCPRFEDVAQEVYDFYAGCNLGGYNIRVFDNLILDEEFTRAGYDFDLADRKCADVFKMWKILEERTLAGAYKRWVGKDLNGAHDAMIDTLASMEVFQKMYDFLITEKDIPIDINFIDSLTTDPNAVDPEGKLIYDENRNVVLNFGSKHNGTTLKEVMRKDRQYCNWVIEKSEMNSSLKYFYKKCMGEIEQQKTR